MSTRSILLFKDSYEIVGIYRHSDGYTSGVIADLEQFFKWNTRDDASYCAANYIYYMKDQMFKWCEKNDLYPDNGVQIGHGVLSDPKNAINSDLEYVHLINLEYDTITVTSYKVLNENPNFKNSYDISIKDDTLKVDQITVFDKGQTKIIKSKKVKIPYSSLFVGA